MAVKTGLAPHYGCAPVPSSEKRPRDVLTRALSHFEVSARESFLVIAIPERYARTALLVIKHESKVSAAFQKLNVTNLPVFLHCADPALTPSWNATRFDTGERVL